ncbi:23S rRNA (adenine(1618)-N(6))-methyltransferase RlmF [Parashewanella spongiae]|uniref:Ribosomal RNA large subunit methyltransferase F n=1 Tax=Parashewanella spongiae TaxID=342950 RepID=A0A3A6T6A7_9GAMM|nr:23S rRNA (adenine(1618)-N(6))-methyltransferase RlmF [Parashewanella spongiae]MCL1080082.1 23S rRNA (adenine(1618)-N(6))-methyltransferase RlmF [Parashewanella spongiae]RJY04941.1 23S rRNA (adenine(1618)-N(6))-methyltransferase RlmF [Parashewanella spongiae]
MSLAVKFASKSKMHPRNLHNQGYDFDKLIVVCPELTNYLVTTPRGETSINFSNPVAVKLLNKALLHQYYGIKHWQLADGFLCPPIPGRVDSLHYIADLLAATLKVPVKKLKHCNIKGLDIGCGANLIYPLLGNSVYGWQFVASDINQPSIQAANHLIESNALNDEIECRWQPELKSIFNNIIQPNEYYDFTMCNPPFHRSAEEANTGTQRKQTNLKVNSQQRGARLTGLSVGGLNFAGQHNELWCEGGESAFICRMIAESKQYRQQCGWFTSLVAKKDNLSAIKKALKKANVKDQKIINMSQGQKISRMICWSFDKK